jgi:outer membrane protein assembly factor BamE (lipoprotein component of BamABCDE complex)
MRHVMLLCLLSLSGCFFPMHQGGTEQLLDDHLLDTITIGATQADVRAKLGEPQRITQSFDADGTVTKWVYEFWRRGNYELVPAYRDEYSRPAIRRTVSIAFASDGTVKQVERSQLNIKDPALLVFP